MKRKEKKKRNKELLIILLESLLYANHIIHTFFILQFLSFVRSPLFVYYEFEIWLRELPLLSLLSLMPCSDWLSPLLSFVFLLLSFHKSLTNNYVGTRVCVTVLFYLKFTDENGKLEILQLVVSHWLPPHQHLIDELEKQQQ